MKIVIYMCTGFPLQKYNFFLDNQTIYQSFYISSILNPELLKIIVADQDTARAVVDELFEFRDVGQCESLLDRRYHGAYHGPCGDGEGHVIGVGRLGDDDLVAGVEARHEGEQHGLGTARPKPNAP